MSPWLLRGRAVPNRRPIGHLSDPESMNHSARTKHLYPKWGVDALPIWLAPGFRHTPNSTRASVTYLKSCNSREIGTRQLEDVSNRIRLLMELSSRFGNRASMLRGKTSQTIPFVSSATWWSRLLPHENQNNLLCRSTFATPSQTVGVSEQKFISESLLTRSYTSSSTHLLEFALHRLHNTAQCAHVAYLLIRVAHWSNLLQLGT